MKRILWVLVALMMFLNIPMDTFAANTNSQYELKLNGVTEVQARQGELATTIYFIPPKTQGYLMKIPASVSSKFYVPYFVKNSDYNSPIFGTTFDTAEYYYMFTGVLQAGERYKLSLSPMQESDGQMKVPVGLYDSLGMDASVMANPQSGSMTSGSKETVKFYQMNVLKDSNYHLTLYCDLSVTSRTNLMLFDDKLQLVEPEQHGIVIGKGIENTYSLKAGRYYPVIRIWGGDAVMKVDYKLALEDMENRFQISYPGSLTMHPGESKMINITFFPESARPESFIFQSDNSSVAEVDQHGKVTAKAVGETVIRFKGSDGVGDYRTVIHVTANGDSGSKPDENGGKPDGNGSKPDETPVKPEQNMRPDVGECFAIDRIKYRVIRSSANESANAVTVLGAVSEADKKIVIPDTVSIRGYIFKVTKLENNAFRNCRKLKEISVGKYVEQIGKETFSGCGKLKNVFIDSTNLKKVGKNAFKGINKKAKISFRAEMEKPYKKLLRNKGQSKTVGYAYIVPQKGEQYRNGNLFYTITKSSAKKGTAVVAGVIGQNLKSAAIPAVVKLGGYTFKVTGISDYAFSGCKKMKKVTIGKNIKTIGSHAFANCAKLKRISVESKGLKKVGECALKEIHSKCVIDVPSNKYKTYRKLFRNKGQEKTVKVRK
ncbi:MAG: leucine-rich repeat protein [Lachnospiraceae bacterium]|nr:leucine-rich repeat protein [Lachnospiraceae bacterium]